MRFAQLDTEGAIRGEPDRHEDGVPHAIGAAGGADYGR
jgi:hypothetical protein